MKSETAQIATEAVAGLLWMYLNVPGDASRPEFETHAQALVAKIRCNPGLAFAEQQLRVLQVQILCGRLDLFRMTELARRVVAVVRGAGLVEERQLAA